MWLELESDANKIGRLARLLIFLSKKLLPAMPKSIQTAAIENTIKDLEKLQAQQGVEAAMEEFKEGKKFKGVKKVKVQDQIIQLRQQLQSLK